MIVAIYRAVIYVAVPLIILTPFALSVSVTRRSPRSLRLSAVSGMFAGLVAFATYLVGSFSGARAPELGLSKTPHFSWFPLASGIVVGFTILLLAQSFTRIRPGLVGLFVLFLSATSSTATFSYFFASPIRDATVFLALGSLFGVLLYIVLNPDLARELLGTTRHG
jgi:hypothetical protein